MLSLRLRLFFSFALLVSLALLLAAGVFVALHYDASERDTLDRVAAVVPAVSFELRGLYDRGAASDEISAFLRQSAQQDGVRLLLVDQRTGSVAMDSGGTLFGQRLGLPSFGPPVPRSGARLQSWSGATTETKRLTFFASVYQPAGRPFPLGRTTSDPGGNLITVAAIPRETLANAWLGLLPELLWPGIVALLLSAGMAILLSRSIARPILALTRASEGLARGQFDQEVPQAGSDEIGRLAATFNIMVREMGRSYLQTQALIANASHDLKTPLTSILGFSQALSDGAADSPEEVAELSGIIHEEAERIYAMVADLLYLSQIDSGEVALQRVPVKLEDVVARSLRRFESMERQPGVSVSSRLEQGIWVLADGGKLDRILDNLLDNARKYTPPGGRIVLTTARAPGELAQGLLSVTNTGVSLPPGELERVFDRFYRGDPARGSAIGGTGLGLAIVKDLVRLQRGSVMARSDPSSGTTFEVRLPLAPVPLLPAGPPERRQLPAAEAGPAA